MNVHLRTHYVFRPVSRTPGCVTTVHPADPAMREGQKGQGGPLPLGKNNKSNNKHNFTKDVAGAGAHIVFSAGGGGFELTPLPGHWVKPVPEYQTILGLTAAMVCVRFHNKIKNK